MCNCTQTQNIRKVNQKCQKWTPQKHGTLHQRQQRTSPHQTPIPRTTQPTKRIHKESHQILRTSWSSRPLSQLRQVLHPQGKLRTKPHLLQAATRRHHQHPPEDRRQTWIRMGSCLIKANNTDEFNDTSRNSLKTRRFKFIKHRDADFPKFLHKRIKGAYKDGIVSETEYVLTCLLFTYLLNRLEASLDPLFITQMKALQKTLDTIIQERCQFPPPAPDENYSDMFEDFFLQEIRRRKWVLCKF